MNAPLASVTRPRLNVVSVSTGKDSTGTAIEALEKCPRESLRFVSCDTGNEHEEFPKYLSYMERELGITIDVLRADFTDRIAARRTFVALDHREPKRLVKQHGDEAHPERVTKRSVKWVRHTNKAKRRILEALKPTGNPYLDLCLWKGRFPSRRAQFCTQHLKTEPMVEYQMALIDQGYEVWSWQGVRADESPNRALLAELEEVGGGLWNYRPILRWTAQQSIDRIIKAGLNPNPLYSQGMTRVGCMPCINAAKPEILQISKRFPGHIERIELWEYMVRLASKRGDASFFPDPTEDAHLNRRGIHNVVQWSKTSRGGRQFNFFADEAPRACSSAYGLCE